MAKNSYIGHFEGYNHTKGKKSLRFMCDRGTLICLNIWFREWDILCLESSIGRYLLPLWKDCDF